jgi:hypothetical protein
MTRVPIKTCVCLVIAELLAEHLQERAEDECDYQAPEEGSLVYKLYSLANLLVLVRSSLALTYSRAGSNGINRVRAPPQLAHSVLHRSQLRYAGKE